MPVTSRAPVRTPGRPNWSDRRALASVLRAALPDDVRLLITGDHGMVDIAVDRRLTVEDHPDLLAGVGLIGGEGRFRQLYVKGKAAPVAARWADRLGSDA